MAPAIMAPRFVGAELLPLLEGLFPGEPSEVEVAVEVERPVWVTVKTGGWPVAMGPEVAGLAAGEVAVAAPEGEPPIMDMIAGGTR